MKTDINWYADYLPSMLESVIEGVRGIEYGSGETFAELTEALSVALAAAERLRLERRLLQRVN